MLLINVLDDARKEALLAKMQPRRTHLVPLVFGLLLVLATGSFAPRSAQILPTSRELFVDEKEMVVSTFAALSPRVPELSGWIDNTRELFVEGAFPAFLVDGKRLPLVRFEDDTLFFARAFFDADPMQQETALLDVVVTFHQGEPRQRARPPEVAVVGE